jgi:hypothetical protein
MGWHGMGAVAPGRLDSGGRRTPRGRGGRVANRGGGGGASDVGAAADMWGRATSGPVVSGGMQKGVERTRQRQRRELTGGTGSTVPPVRF